MSHSIDSALGDRAVFDSLNLGVLLEAIEEAVIITGSGLDSPGPAIKYVNTSFERMTGYNRREVIGRSPRLLQGPDTSRAELDRMKSALREHRTFEGEAINYRKNGQAFRVRWAVAPIYDDFGDVTAWLSVQREAEEARPPNLSDLACGMERGLETSLRTP